MSLSARAIASKLGISHTAVNKAAATGRIQREADGGFDLEKVRKAWHENTNVAQQARGCGGKRAAPASTSPQSTLGPGPTLHELQRMDLATRVAERQLRLKKQQGELV